MCVPTRSVGSRLTRRAGGTGGKGAGACMQTDRDVMAGRWVTSLMQCMLLSCAACMIAVAQTLKDAGCGGLGAVFSGTCDVHTPAAQTIRMAVPLPEGGWGGEAQVRCCTPHVRVCQGQSRRGRWHRWGNAQACV